MGTGSLYNPANTPAPGTQTLFDKPGQMSTPASGSVFTWYAYNSAYSPVVPAGSAENAVAKTGAAGATATKGTRTKVTTTASAGATSTGSSSSDSITKNSAQGLQPQIIVVVGCFLLLGFSPFL